MQTTSQIARAVQSTTGKVFQLRPSCPSDWAGEWPTDRSGNILVSEAPGTADGSIFGYWLGDRTLACEGVVAAIQAHMDDHDVIGAEVIFAFPDHVHSSLKADLAELKEQAATASMLALREGIRVRVKSNQARLGGAKFPGREGIIQSENCISGNYWNVRLLATNRAQERVELFDEHALEVLTTLAELATLPPISGREFSRQLDTSSTLVFGGSSYALVPH